jgi:peptide/nickel transport system substrate-binding protein
MPRRYGSLAAVMVISCGLTACAGSDPARTTRLTVLAEGDVDSLDPGTTNYQFGVMVVGAMQQTLFAYTPGAKGAVPQLAAAPALVSRDGRRVSVRLREGVRFSPPVSREVRAADVKYALERSFLPSVANGYARTYFGALVGLGPYLAGRARGISGIRLSGRYGLELRFSRRVAGVAARALALPISAPVPAEYARPLDRGAHSRYGMRPVSTGPFMLNPGTRAYVPGERIELVRNRSWRPTATFRRPGFSAISILEGFSPAVASRRILGTKNTVSGDFLVPRALIASHRGDARLSLTPSGGVAYVALNTRVPPFDNPNVRRAVAAVLDRTAMRASLGGPSAGEIATHFLPPGIPGFAEAGGARGPGFDFLMQPAGNLALAKRYMHAAGYPSGRYDGAKRLLVPASSDPASRGVAQVVQHGLAQLGIKTRLQLTTPEGQARFCGTVPTEAAVCPDGGWLKEFDDPQTMLDGPFNGRAISATGNTNLSLFDSARVNRMMTRAEELVRTPDRLTAWAAIDYDVTAEAPAIPWLWSNSANLRSGNVAIRVNPLTARWDLASAYAEDSS